MKQIKTQTLWIEANIIDVLCDFSHQHVYFPATPCGSYTTSSIELRAFGITLNCYCGYANRFSKNEHSCDYRANFEIVGDNQNILIEPTCGSLAVGNVYNILRGVFLKLI